MNENIEKILENFEEKGKSFIDIIYNYNSIKEKKKWIKYIKKYSKFKFWNNKINRRMWNISKNTK